MWRSGWVMTALALSAAGLALWGVSRAASAPHWWNPPRPTSARVIRNAEELEGAAMAQLTLVREGNAPWSVSISQHDANDWLAARLPLWLESRGQQLPAQVRTVSAAFTGEGVYLGAKVQPGGRVFWVLVEPRVDDRGLWLTAVRAGMGDVPVPVDQALASDLLPPEARAVLRGERLALADASTTVDGSRRVRLVHLRSFPGSLEVSAVTEGR